MNSSNFLLPVLEEQIKSGENVQYLLSDAEPRLDSFFFCETSGRSFLTAREVCSVESAARHHPNNSINVVMTSPSVDLEGVLREVMREHPNIIFRHVDFESFIMRYATL